MQIRPPAALFAGDSLCLLPLAGGIVELRFDRRDGAVNMFDQRTVAELDAARAQLAQLPWLRGILVSSAKDVFVVGADIKEFTTTFAQPRPALLDYLRRSNAVFLRFEALDVPSVAAINGFALGGGLEFALVASHRVMAEGARVGLPEVGLGLIPGFGGTVRLPRIAGLAPALEWISDGAPRAAAEALRCGVVDRVAPVAQLRCVALELLQEAADWQERRAAKRRPLTLEAATLQRLVAQRQAEVARTVPAHLPAAAAAVALLAESALLGAADAQEAEARAFATLAHSPAAGALVRNFINQQAVKRLARQLARVHAEAPGGSPVGVFASPLPGATLVELAAAPDADGASLARAAAEAAAAGKVALRVGPAGGGMLRRVHAACLRACAGWPAAVVDAAVEGAGWTLGPFAVERLLRQDTGASPPAARAAQLAPASAPPPAAAVVERLLLATIVEAANVLDQGIVGSAAEVDIGLQLGLGFPRHLGGPLHHADRLGLPQVCERIHAAGLALPPTLASRAASGHAFYAGA